jgi:hypothetical protein
MNGEVLDLIALVPGRDEQATLEGILSRPRALGIRQVSYAIDRHTGRDPGCRLRAVDHMKSAIGLYRYAIVLFDHEGSGGEAIPPCDLERQIEDALARSGWQERAACIVIEPELEAWVWSDSPNVDSELGWAGRHPTLHEWLITENLLAANTVKPSDPKAAMERAMRHVRKPISPYVFTRLAETVGLNRCEDRAFLKLRSVLRGWFATESAGNCSKHEQ